MNVIAHGPRESKARADAKIPQRSGQRWMAQDRMPLLPTRAIPDLPRCQLELHSHFGEMAIEFDGITGQKPRFVA